MYISIADIFFPFLFSFLIPVNMVELCGKVMVAGKNDFFFFFLYILQKQNLQPQLDFPPGAA